MKGLPFLPSETPASTLAADALEWVDGYSWKDRSPPVQAPPPSGLARLRPDALRLERIHLDEGRVDRRRSGCDRLGRPLPHLGRPSPWAQRTRHPTSSRRIGPRLTAGWRRGPGILSTPADSRAVRAALRPLPSASTPPASALPRAAATKRRAAPRRHRKADPDPIVALVPREPEALLRPAAASAPPSATEILVTGGPRPAHRGYAASRRLPRRTAHRTPPPRHDAALPRGLDRTGSAPER